MHTPNPQPLPGVEPVTRSPVWTVDIMRTDSAFR